VNAGSEGTWVYGVVPADAALEELERRQDRLPEVWIVEVGDLAAIVGNLPEDEPTATRDQALAHARVLEAAVVDAPVVPFRFGTIANGSDEVVATELLEARHDELMKLLKKVEGRVQMTLKVDYDEEAVLREIVENEPEIDQLRQATQGQPEDASRDDLVRLGELLSIAVEQRRQADSADIVERLQAAVVATVPEPLEHEFMVLNAACLVERGRQDEFDSTIETVAQERQTRMRFRLLGPMPAYSFIGAAESAWG
jgi:hypothetical protein